MSSSPRRVRMPVPGRAAMAALVVALGLAAGCSTRDHTNPFDPENPDTGGHPDIVTAVARDGAVELKVSVPRLVDFSEAVLTRRTTDSPDKVVASGLTARDTTLVDHEVVNDVTYEYELAVTVTGQGAALKSSTSPVTPGRRVIWVLDQNDGGPVLVSPDGRHIAATPGRGAPSDMDILPATGEVVSADFYNRRLERFDRLGRPLISRAVEYAPLSVAMVPSDSTVWVGGYDPSRLERLMPDLASAIEADSGVGAPEDVALDARRGDVWLADSQGGRLLHFHRGGATALGGFKLPFSLAVDGPTGDAWLADRANHAVYRIESRSDTIAASATAFAAPFQVTSDGTGGVWVTDPPSGRVIHLDAGGGELKVLENLGAPTGLCLDPGGEGLWVTDSAAGELLHVGFDGTVIRRLSGFSGPFAVLAAMP